MDFGAAMFFTDYSMSPTDLGRALEACGFESVWAPEHSHIPSSRATPFPQSGELPQKYYDAMDPFVTFDRGGHGNEDIEDRDRGLPHSTTRPDPDRKAGRLDRSGLRRAVSVRRRRRLERRGNGRPRHRLQKPLQADARAGHGDEAIWTEDEPEFHGELVDFPKMKSWPKPVQRPHPPVIVGGAFPYAARRALRYGDGWVPHAGRPQYADVTDFLPQFRQMAAEAGRSLASVPVTVFGVPEDLDRLQLYRDREIARAVVSLPSAKANEILPVLDRWAELIRRVA